MIPADIRCLVTVGSLLTFISPPRDIHLPLVREGYGTRPCYTPVMDVDVHREAAFNLVRGKCLQVMTDRCEY